MQPACYQTCLEHTVTTASLGNLPLRDANYIDSSGHPQFVNDFVIIKCIKITIQCFFSDKS
jgi:hypothetical protein